MTSQTLQVNLANRTDVTDPYWLNMEIKKDNINDGMTVAEAANIIDSAYNIKICEDGGLTDIWQQTGTNNRDIWTETDASETIDKETVEAQERFASELINGGYTEDCNNDSLSINDLITYKVTIKIFRSDPLELYKLQMTNGVASNPVIFRDRVVHNIDVDNQTSVTLNNPIVNYRQVKAPVIVWNSNGPKIHIKGNTLYWDEPFTGTLRAEFDTEWDEVTIHVTGEPSVTEIITGTDVSHLGTGWYSGSEDGSEISDYQDIECSVLGFYHYQYEELILNSPEDDTSATETDKLNICHFITNVADTTVVSEDAPDKRCKRHINETVVCQCSGKESSSGYYVPVNCPSGVSDGTTIPGSLEKRTYSDCGYKDEANDPAVYEEKCCKPWPFDSGLPKCKTIVTKFTNIDDSEEGDEDKEKYPEGTTVIRVGPARGYCGDHTTKQVMNALNCCDDVSQLFWDYENSAEEVAPSSSAVVCVSGGKLPYEIKVRGQGFYLDAARTKRDGTSSSRCFDIFTNDEACGTAKIYVTDGCSSVVGTIRCTEGVWKEVDISYAECGEATSESGSAFSYSAERLVGDLLITQTSYSLSYIRCVGCENAVTPPPKFCVFPKGIPYEKCSTNDDTFFLWVGTGEPTPAGCGSSNWSYMGPIYLRVFKWSCE